MSSSNRVRLLLDSTYLLPIVGIDVKGVDKALMVLEKLHDEARIECYYTPFNLLEIIGKMSKVEYDGERVITGLKSIDEEFQLINPTTQALIKALNLKSMGYKDLIDLLLYTTSLTSNIKLLTRDYNLIKFLRESKEETDNILHEREFIKIYGG